MTIGERIKKIREFRKLSQRALGIAIGYDEKTARARISQYEINNRTPSIETAMLLANALNINVNSIQNYSLDSSNEIMKYLFWLDEKMGRKGVRLYQTDANAINLQMRTPTDDMPMVGINIDYEGLETKLYDWHIRKEQLAKGELSAQNYFEWIIGYPHE